MKFCRDINYEDFGITEEAGWTPSYDWGKLGKSLRRIGIGVNIFIATLSPILVMAVFNEYEVVTIMLSVIIAISIFLLILTPMHEILHFMPIVGLKLGDKCFMIFGKGTVSAFYKGKITNKQNCVSLITPFIGLGLFLVANIIILPDIFKLCAVFLLIMHVGGCYSDIYMFFYMRKHFSKNTIFFGNRYRAK